jgi:hypothetical protein
MMRRHTTLLLIMCACLTPWLMAPKVGAADPGNGVASLTLSRSIVAGGVNATGKVTLNTPAPTGGAVVVLTNTNPAASVPTTITVPAGASHQTFTILTSAVTATQTGVITAGYDGTSQSATVSVRPIGVKSFSISAYGTQHTFFVIRGGDSCTATVTLECAAAPTDIVVRFTSNNPTVVPAPASITIPQGSQTATVTINTTVTTRYQGAVLIARANHVARSIEFTITPVF